jgi:O-antigen ligase
MTAIFNITENRIKSLFICYCAVICLMIPFVLYFGGKILLFAVFAPIPLIMLVYNFDRYMRVALVSFMFTYFYFSVEYRIQLINLLSYILIFYFLVNHDKDIFNKFSLPKFIKVSSSMLIFAVFLSAVNSQFVSAASIYYAVMFFVYILTGYIVFKTILDFEDIDNYLKYLIYSVAIYGIIILANIMVTGAIRSRGITGSAFSDIIVCSLLVTLFKYFFLEGYRTVHIIIGIILLLILVADLSRFAWVGFALSTVYGILLISKFDKSGFLKRRIKIVIASFMVGLMLILGSGLYNVIAERFSDVSFSILQADEGKDAIGNSLDTRGLIWITALNAFINNPYTGVGYFMFHSVSDKYNILPEVIFLEFVDGLDAHSTLMNFLCETGLIGLSAILFFYIVVYMITFKSIRISKNREQISRSLILNILVFFIITTSVYSGAFTFGYNGYFLYFMMALAVGNYVLIKKNNNQNIAANSA